jgi:hypothetical protein
VGSGADLYSIPGIVVKFIPLFKGFLRTGALSFQVYISKSLGNYKKILGYQISMGIVFNDSFYRGKSIDPLISIDSNQ